MKLTHFALACQVYILLMGEGMSSNDQISLSWFEAQTNCTSQNGSLPVSPEEVNYTGNMPIWRGVYRRISAWIKILGCYKDNETEAVSTTVYMMQKMSKSAGFCQEICLSYNFSVFALKGNLCRCLTNRPKGNKVSPTFCNALCYKPEERSEKPYFDECGGKEYYSVYISVTEDEKKSNSSGIFCVGIQCSTTATNNFFVESCSNDYHPLCNRTDRKLNTTGNWSRSMHICKSKPFSTYLFGDVFLNDINRTCDVIGQELPEKSWLGVTNEVYTGVDQGIKIGEEERKMFTGCFVCFYKDNKFKNCSFVECKDEQNIKLLCIPRNQESTDDQSSQTILGILQTSTLVFNFWSSTKASESTVSSTTYITKDVMISSSTDRTTAETINPKEKSEDALQIIIPTAIAGSLIVVISALVSKYLCFRPMKKKPSLQKQKLKQDHGDANNSGPGVTGIINHSYFTIELQEQGFQSSTQEDDLNAPHIEAKEEIYNHLRDTESSIDKEDTKCNYDTTKNIIAKREQCNECNESTYNRLGDVQCDTNADDTYHHAFTNTDKNCEYDVTEIRKQYILDSPYNEVLHIVTDDGKEEQDRKSDNPEKDNEDHTYFILDKD